MARTAATPELENELIPLGEVSSVRRGRQATVNESLLTFLRTIPLDGLTYGKVRQFGAQTDAKGKQKVGQQIRNHWKMLDNGFDVVIKWTDEEESFPQVGAKPVAA